MATMSELLAASEAADESVEKLRGKVREVVAAVLAAFDKVLETNTYRVASPRADRLGSWDNIGERNEPAKFALTKIVEKDDGKGRHWAAIRFGVIPDPGMRFMVLWVDINMRADPTLSVAETDMPLDLAGFDAVAAAAAIEGLVQATTDRLLADYRSDAEVRRRLVATSRPV